MKEALEVNGFDMLDEEYKKDIITMGYTLNRIDEMMPTVNIFQHKKQN